MKLIGLIILKIVGIIVQVAVAVNFSACVEHTTINARTVNVTKPVNVTARIEMDGLPIPLK